MNLYLAAVNALGSALICICLAWAVLTPGVRDGVIVKAGLICMSLGFGSIAARFVENDAIFDVVSLERAILLVNSGLAIVIIGYVLRKARTHHSLRRATDWGALMEDRPLSPTVEARANE